MDFDKVKTYIKLMVCWFRITRGYKYNKKQLEDIVKDSRKYIYKNNNIQKKLNTIIEIAFHEYLTIQSESSLKYNLICDNNNMIKNKSSYLFYIDNCFGELDNLVPPSLRYKNFIRDEEFGDGF